MLENGKPVVWIEPSDQEILVKADELQDLISRLYQRVNVRKEDSVRMADLQVETDLRGVHSHGTRAVVGYISRIQNGHTNPNPNIEITKEGPSFAMVDGDGGLGHLASSRAMEIAIQKAMHTGISAVGVVNSRHFGAAACYATMALCHGMVGFCVSSSSRGITPYGGIERLLGNHPLAYAVPAKKEYPLVLDMATGVSAWGRIRTMQMFGRRLDGEWIVDQEGNLTDNPEEGYALLPFGGLDGGLKGSGISVIMDVLSGILPFGVATVNRGEEYSGQWMASHFFYAIKIENFIPLETFTSEVDRMVQAIRNSKRREGVDRIYLPGEIEWLKKKAWSKSGIPLHRGHVDQLSVVSEELGISTPW